MWSHGFPAPDSPDVPLMNCSHREGATVRPAHETGRALWLSSSERQPEFEKRLAHGYASVDVERFWRETPAGLDDLDTFAQAMADFLEQSE